MVLYLTMICICLVAAVVVIAIKLSKSWARDGEKLKQAEKVLSDVSKANRAAATDDYDDRLRDKYGLK